MIHFTPDAQRRYDNYLQRMRSTLRGSSSVEPEEIEQNVLEHVELALADAPAPVGIERLGEVLTQLGPPERWLPEEERPWWRRVMDRVMNGPEDWRLAYASFGLTFLMIIAFPIGGILLLLPAFLLSRAFVELVTERGEALGARRWLVLPPIVFALMLASGIILIAPPAAFAAMLGEGTLRELGFAFRDHAERGLTAMSLLCMFTGAWWLVLSGLFAALYRPYRALFLPVTANLRRGHALVLTIAGVVVAGIGATLLWVF